MKAPEFDYHRPEDISSALELLARYGDDAQILAGGQSLMPMLHMRLVKPSALIDINHIGPLSGIIEDETAIRMGAITRYVELEHSEIVRRCIPLLTRALPFVAHTAIRNRGTIGGSLVLCDPAAEMPACALASDAVLELASVSGSRNVRAADFFLGMYETARNSDELLVSISYPKTSSSATPVFSEFSRRHGDYAIAGIAGHVWTEGDRIKEARLVFFGCAERPVLAVRTAEILRGETWSDSLVGAAKVALRSDMEPLNSFAASAEYRMHLACVLLDRSLRNALGPSLSGSSTRGMAGS